MECRGLSDADDVCTRFTAIHKYSTRRSQGATENAGLENAGPNRRGGKRGTGKRGTKSHGWKSQDWKMRDQVHRGGKHGNIICMDSET